MSTSLDLQTYPPIANLMLSLPRRHHGAILPAQDPAQTSQSTYPINQIILKRILPQHPQTLRRRPSVLPCMLESFNRTSYHSRMVAKIDTQFLVDGTVVCSSMALDLKRDANMHGAFWVPSNELLQ